MTEAPKAIKSAAVLDSNLIGKAALSDSQGSIIAKQRFECVFGTRSLRLQRSVIGRQGPRHSPPRSLRYLADKSSSA
ncbi:MAG TPA: hypothetical protein VLX29_03325 [Nitrospirota bacterium]|nr:hypothetical protein [Nitrospirota bacterium]